MHILGQKKKPDGALTIPQAISIIIQNQKVLCEMIKELQKDILAVDQFLKENHKGKILQ